MITSYASRSGASARRQASSAPWRERTGICGTASGRVSAHSSAERWGSISTRTTRRRAAAMAPARSPGRAAGEAGGGAPNGSVWGVQGRQRRLGNRGAGGGRGAYSSAGSRGPRGASAPARVLGGARRDHGHRRWPPARGRRAPGVGGAASLSRGTVRPAGIPRQRDRAIRSPWLESATTLGPSGMAFREAPTHAFSRHCAPLGVIESPSVGWNHRVLAQGEPSCAPGRRR